MFLKLFVLFIALPLVELALLIRLGGWIGYWPTIGIVFLTGLVGAGLAQQQGGSVIRRIRGELQGGRMPVQALLDGLLVLIGGVVLLTPGVLTDLLGIMLLIPWTRGPFRRLVRRKLRRLVGARDASFAMLLK